MKKNILKYILTIFIVSNSALAYSQDYKDYISSQWDNYYNSYPSGIENNFQASNFIKIIDLLEYSPPMSGRTYALVKGDINLFKKLLLSLPFEALQQMSITGNFYSRSKKHDDYFELYKLNYKQISKETWDKYCPYLIPLMELDGTIKLH